MATRPQLGAQVARRARSLPAETRPARGPQAQSGSRFPEAWFPVSSFLIDTISPLGSSKGIGGRWSSRLGKPAPAPGSVRRTFGGSPTSHGPLLIPTPKIRAAWAPAGTLEGERLEEASLLHFLDRLMVACQARAGF